MPPPLPRTGGVGQGWVEQSIRPPPRGGGPFFCMNSAAGGKRYNISRIKMVVAGSSGGILAVSSRCPGGILAVLAYVMGKQ